MWEKWTSKNGKVELWEQSQSKIAISFIKGQQFKI